MLTPRSFSMAFGLFTALIAHGDVPQDYDLGWHEVGSGGGSGAAEGIRLGCTIAQSVAGSGTSGSHVLLLGYQAGATRIGVPGDCDRNGIVQLDDFACFTNCFTGGSGPPAAECTLFDLDSDGDVDGDDYGNFQVQLENT